MLIRARALNLCIPMEDLKYVLSRRRQEKDLSHSQDVTGNVQAIFIRMKRLGKSFSSVALIVSARDDGLSFSSTFIHFCLQISYSSSTRPGLGRSSLYTLTKVSNSLLLSPFLLVTSHVAQTLGTKYRSFTTFEKHSQNSNSVP